jgi:hypothetical protein
VNDVSAINYNGHNNIAYCFHSVDGFSKIGSYKGNGSTDGSFIYTGFQPKYVLIKDTDTAESWLIYDTERSESNLTDDFLIANTSGAEVTNNSSTNLDILSNGFKIRVTNTSLNKNGDEYIYMAFAEFPFKFANAR